MQRLKPPLRLLLGTIGVAKSPVSLQLGSSLDPDADVIAVIPGGMGTTWPGWEPGCTVIDVPEFPQYVVLAAGCPSINIYVILDSEHPGTRAALSQLCSEDLSGLQLLSPGHADCLLLFTDAREKLEHLMLRARPRMRPGQTILPPPGLVQQLPTAFRKCAPEGRRRRVADLAIFLTGDAVLHREATAFLGGSAHQT